MPSPAECFMTCASGRARRVVCCVGQRNRAIEQALSDLRNVVAHASDDHLVEPVEAECVLRDLTEIINQLWGAPTYRRSPCRA